LKGYITEPTMQIERKGFDTETVPNRLKDHPWRRTASGWCPPGDERRFCVLDVSDARQQDCAYFGALQAEIDAEALPRCCKNCSGATSASSTFRRAPRTGGPRRPEG
jgi:hypothetical protein